MNRQPGKILLAGGPDKRGCDIFLGTSGYSYTEWVDNGFYPPGTKSATMLELYSRCFSTVELNYVWYQMARAEPLARMAAKAPQHFRFSSKLTRTMTHERDSEWRAQLQLYREGIVPILERLVAVLVQLPPDFDRTVGNRRYLAELLDGLQGLPVAVEFRHASWAIDSVFKELERRRVTLVTVDEPELPGLFPSLDVITNPDLFYVRFHGRNESGWRSDNMQKKFDYDYSENELFLWCEQKLPQLAAHASHGVIYFNNHVRAQAPNNARRLEKILLNRATG
ncbi:MAG: DUF72 domain-containing protein [Desulfocapsaceae bacterium]|nr:DUF72 domain-containing protein [Desulfocapsaceae bacterium]